MQTKVEPYLTPKGIADALEREHGLRLSADYICAVREECARRGFPIFIASFARASAVLQFLAENPRFRRRMIERQRPHP